MWSHKEIVRQRKSAWKAMVLAGLFGGVGLFYVGFQPGLLAVAAWCGAMALATWLTIGRVSSDNISGTAFFVTNALFVWPAFLMVRRHNRTIPASLEVGPDSFQRVKNIGKLVIGASLCTMLAALNLVAGPAMGGFGRFAHDMSIVWLPMSVWGIATGIGLLRSWPWSRVSILVFSTLLAAVSMLGVIVFLSMPRGNLDMSIWELFLFKTFVVSQLLIPAVIGVRWVMYFRRDNVRAHFHTSRTAQTASA
jgi:hypothetical protein